MLVCPHNLTRTVCSDTVKMYGSTVKFINFRTPENYAVNYIEFKQRGQTLGYFIKKDANGRTNSEDPDQTAPLGAV